MDWGRACVKGIYPKHRDARLDRLSSNTAYERYEHNIVLLFLQTKHHLILDRPYMITVEQNLYI